MADPSAGRDGAAWFADQIRRLDSAIAELSRASGTQMYQSVAKLRALVEDIQQQLDQWTATRYTNEQLDSILAGKANSVHTHDQSQVTGTWSKGISTTEPVFFVNAYNTDLTSARRTAWIQSDGRLGYASSSLTKKTDVEPADIDVDALLSVEPITWRYIAELNERTRRAGLPSPYADWNPDYPVARELGLAAEALDDAGLSQLVYYDSAGNPEGIEYSMLGVPLLAAVRRLAERAAANEDAIANLTRRLDEMERSTIP
ncbi:hypothetical protein [Microbacterium binotii]|uniref:Peptidase S74 domain-containing protein n=1 Tax=Microbacterium binotii TaxID=462710 RepID=A0ABP6BQL5_9MICO